MSHRRIYKKRGNGVKRTLSRKKQREAKRFIQRRFTDD